MHLILILSYGPMRHRLARLASVLCLAGLATPVRAQLPGLGAVEGGVSAPEGPVAGAAVRLVGADRRTTTDQFGRYRLDDVAPVSERPICSAVTPIMPATERLMSTFKAG